MGYNLYWRIIVKSPDKRTSLLLAVIFSILFAVTAFGPALYAQANPDVRSETDQFLLMFEYLFKYVQNHYVDEVSSEQLYEGAVKGLFESLDDPYSVYLTASDMEDYSDTTTGEFGGVGLYISKQVLGEIEEDESENATFRAQNAPFVEVISPIEGTPAYRAGISAGDFIIAIDGESTGDLSMDEVLARLRGEPGTEVTMRISRRGGLFFNAKVTRAVIEVPTIKYSMLPDGIGYIKIIKWTPYTRDRMREALRDLDDQGYTSLIIDVRGNPGGLLSSVVDTADLFLSRGPIVSTRSSISEENEVYYAKRRTSVPLEVPIVVLINQGSASASEIMAGAMKDTGRAILMGDTTFGKGSVQQVRAFGSGGFKITTSRYYTPDGINIDKVGIDPHKFVELEEFTDEDLSALQQIYDEEMIAIFVEENPVSDEQKIDAFVADVEEKGIILDEKILRKLIREEYNRNLNSPPIYDLEYDIALKEAAKALETGMSVEEYLESLR